MNAEMEKWEREGGIKFLEKIGIKPGQIVLDFGCRVGHYTIPIAKIVGKKGKVYALDKDKQSLNELRKKAVEEGLENITLIESIGDLKIPLEDESVDIILLYDILHLVDDRRKLYEEAHKVLRKGKLLSVYPKHNKFDSPGWGLKNLNLEDIKKEIVSCGFYFDRKYCDVISHDDEFNKGCILNFIKDKK